MLSANNRNIKLSALLVQVDFRTDSVERGRAEFTELVYSAGYLAKSFQLVRRRKPHPAFFIGEGQIQNLAEQVVDQKIAVVIFDQALSPGQEYNLQKSIGCYVLDRVGLILEIFSKRARTHEGKLQVELAQLAHLSTRLIRGWTHLERQRGGIGLKGPGESQLESDRRQIRQRIKKIEKKLERVRTRRAQGRRMRGQSEHAVVALVGYTNAGKSTLFNKLTGAQVRTADKLFETLDPTIRRAYLGEGRSMILVDTVGFIRNIPHSLVAAFRATLEEVTAADLLLHVIDVNCVDRHQQQHETHKVLSEIGAGNIPVITIYNKVDAICTPVIAFNSAEHVVQVSAMIGIGLDALKALLLKCLYSEKTSRHTDGKIDLLDLDAGGSFGITE